MDNVGERIKNRRKALSISQEALAERCGYKSKVSISRIENGKQEVPLNMVPDLAKALYTTPSCLLGWDVTTESMIPVDDDTAKYIEMLNENPFCKVLLDKSNNFNSMSLQKLIEFFDTLYN